MNRSMGERASRTGGGSDLRTGWRPDDRFPDCVVAGQAILIQARAHLLNEGCMGSPGAHRAEATNDRNRTTLDCACRRALITRAVFGNASEASRWEVKRGK